MFRAVWLGLIATWISVAQIAVTLRSHTSLVLIPVAVSGAQDQPITGLERSNFRLFDDGAEQAITHFGREDEPVAVGLVFDTSGSMADKLGYARLAAAEFLKLNNPEDEFFLVEFDSRPRLTVGLTSDSGRIANHLVFSRSKGPTALVDAIYMALAEIRRSGKRKKALLVISDGGDNSSRYRSKELENALRESDVLVYSIGVSSSRGQYNPALLSLISEQTGGRLFESGAIFLPEVAKTIGTELRNRYVLGYAPTNQMRDGKYHRVEVRVSPPPGLSKLRPAWKMGYYAPVN
jgi:VWFA-related protein